MPRHLSPDEEVRRLRIIMDCEGRWAEAARRIGVSPSAIPDFLSTRGLRNLSDIQERITALEEST